MRYPKERTREMMRHMWRAAWRRVRLAGYFVGPEIFSAVYLELAQVCMANRQYGWDEKNMHPFHPSKVGPVAFARFFVGLPLSHNMVNMTRRRRPIP